MNSAGNDIGMIFQEPMTSLDPLYTIGYQIREAVELHQGLRGTAARQAAIKALRDVGIPDPEQRVDAYPHQMSGGMRQRVMIAIALSCNPQLLIADEPTTALDVTMQARILDLLKELRQSRQMSLLLITHNMGLVAEMCDRVIVMYKGRIFGKQAGGRAVPQPGTSLHAEPAPVHPTAGQPAQTSSADRGVGGSRRLSAVPDMGGSAPRSGTTVMPFNCHPEGWSSDASQAGAGETCGTSARSTGLANTADSGFEGAATCLTLHADRNHRRLGVLRDVTCSMRTPSCWCASRCQARFDRACVASKLPCQPQVKHSRLAVVVECAAQFTDFKLIGQTLPSGVFALGIHSIFPSLSKTSRQKHSPPSVVYITSYTRFCRLEHRPSSF